MSGRLRAADLGLVINTADPYSVEVGRHYAQRRGLAPEQVLEVALPLKPVLSREEFEQLAAKVAGRFGPKVQALALAWRRPYAVECHSITSALSLGFDAELCRDTCGPARSSPYFNARSHRPFTDLGLRPSMLLAAPDVARARELIERGIASERSLARRGASAQAVFVTTPDRARNVRAPLYPRAGPVGRTGVEVQVLPQEALGDARRVMLLQTGAARIEPLLPRLHWVDGALADHLTSFGGQLGNAASGQTDALAWIGAGATASYGTVSEPCSHPQKFPHPQLLLLHYLQGATAIEAYWKSVAWPQQGVFIGEPLAAPFARR